MGVAMDPVSLIVMALAVGASSGLKSTAAAAVQDAYGGLKRLIERKYGGVDVAPVEKRPDSEAKRQSLAEDLADAGAADDSDLLEAAHRLIAEVRAHDPGAGPALGVDLEHVEAEFLRVRDVTSEGTGVRVREGKFGGGIDVEGIRAGPGAGERRP